MEMIAYTVLKLLGEDPSADLWPSIKIDDSDSLQEKSAKYYLAKRNFLMNESRPRYKQVIEFIRFNNNC